MRGDAHVPPLASTTDGQRPPQDLQDMRTLLFVVHGMGMRAETSKDGQVTDLAMRSWYADVVDSLRALAAQYALPLAFDMDTRAGFDPAGKGADAANAAIAAATRRVTVVPVTYCDILADSLTRLATQGADLGEALQKVGSGIDQEVAAFLKDKNDPNAGFPFTHVADVVLLRFDRDTRAQVRLRIAKTVIDARRHWNDEDDQLPRIAFLSHSLGTFATIDALHAMITNAEAEHLPSFQDNIIDIEFVCTLANVSRVLNLGGGIDPYQSPVRPRTVAAPGVARGVVRTMVDARHDLDPIVWAWPYHTPTWNSLIDYQHASLTALRQINVHGFCHYLADPRVHGVLLNLLSIGGRQLSQATIAAAVAAYDAADPANPCAAAITTLRRDLEHLKLPDATQASMKQWLEVVHGAWTAIETARTSCIGGLKV
jgi:hypothetical protein